MKKIVFKEQKMSFKSNYKLRMKLYNLMLQKKFKNIFSFQGLKILLPALALVIFTIWFVNLSLDINNTWSTRELVQIERSNISKVNERLEKIWNKHKVKKYENITKDRIVRAKMQSYKYKALARKIKARQTNYKW